MRKFTIEKKLVAVVRYYETMYLIKDNSGERVYTGNNEVTATKILRLLNAGGGKSKRKRKARRK